MSKLKKCLYLINLMERKGAMTLKEINDCYEYSSLYEGDEFLPRTFLRYREYIEETFPKRLSLVISILINEQVSMSCTVIRLYMVRMIRFTTICCRPIISRE